MPAEIFWQRLTFAPDYGTICSSGGGSQNVARYFFPLAGLQGIKNINARPVG
jgi:hypothetical protein